MVRSSRAANRTAGPSRCQTAARGAAHSALAAGQTQARPGRSDPARLSKTISDLGGGVLRWVLHRLPGLAMELLSRRFLDAPGPAVAHRNRPDSFSQPA